MRRRFALLAAAGSLAATAVPVSPAPASHGPIAVAACKSATIGGAHRCIARGQFCAKSHARDYRKYGLSCTKRDYNGRWHLQ